MFEVSMSDPSSCVYVPVIRVLLRVLLLGRGTHWGSAVDHVIADVTMRVSSIKYINNSI